MVGKRFLHLLFLLVSIGVHTSECFSLCREIFGHENVMPSGNDDNNNEVDKNKTIVLMKTKNVSQENSGQSIAQNPESRKNPLTLRS